jgi:putative DNA primase/helicase
MLGALEKRPTHVGKLELMLEWNKPHSEEYLRSVAKKSANLGLRTGDFPPVDIDCPNPLVADAVEKAIADELGVLVSALTVRWRHDSAKRTLLFALKPGAERFTKTVVRGLDADGEEQKVEFLAEGQQTIVAGRHPDGALFQIRGPHPADVGPDGMIQVDKAIVRRLREVAAEAMTRAGCTPGKVTSGRAKAGKASAGRGKAQAKAPNAPREQLTRFQYLNQVAFQRILDWAPKVLPRGYADGHGGWRVKPGALGRTCEEDLSINPSGIQDWGQEQEKRVGYTPIDLLCDFFEALPSDDGTCPAVLAEEWGGDRPLGKVTKEQAIAWFCREFSIDWDAECERDAESADDLSENALAQRFADQHCEDVRFAAKEGRWMEWDGTRWCPDEKLHMMTLARVFCRQEAREGDVAPALRRQLQSANTIASVLRLAQSDARTVVGPDHFDQNPWLLNTPDGTFDLKSGEMREHRREDYLTKRTAVAPEGDCPRWRAFVAQITGDDRELAEFIQRALGYGLTGSTREQCLFFLYGQGANGKSVLLNTVSGLIAEYHRTAPISTFVESHNEQHRTDLASLRGPRLVTAIETAEGGRWNEAKLKALTGGDPISARFMRGDFFEFRPQFKLFIAGNRKPSLRTVDEAIKRRIHLIPFTVTIKPEDRDPNLMEKLKVEWPGILRWMIRGCLAWQRGGLKPPAAVRTATEEYLAGEDAIAAWLNECCVVDPNVSESSTKLFKSWAAWAGFAKEPIGTHKSFSPKLEAQARLGNKRRKKVCISMV